MKRKLGIYFILALVVCLLSGCSLYDIYATDFVNDQVVMDAWERGRRAEERGEYEKARQEYYFVKHHATTYLLQKRAQKRYDKMSRQVETIEGQY